MKMDNSALLVWKCMSIGVALVVSSVSLHAATIYIANHSFEDPVVSPGTFSTAVPSGWSGPSSGPPWVHNPTTSTTSDGNAPDGDNVLVTAGVSGYSQATTSSYAPGTSYSLQVEAGIRKDMAVGNARYDYRVYAGGTLIHRDIGLNDSTLFSAPGTFLTKTVTAGPIHSQLSLGGNIGVHVGGGSVGTSGQVMHDNVRLSSSAAPAPRVFNASFEAIQKVEAYPSPDFSPVGWTTSGDVWLVNPTTDQTVGGAVSDGHMAVVTWSPGASLTQVIDETFRLGLGYSLYVDVASRLDSTASGTSWLRLRGVDSNYIYGEANMAAATLESSKGNFFTFGFDLDPYSSVPGTGIEGEYLQIEMVAGSGQWLWDNVEFSTVIPEPGSAFLLLIGSCLLWVWRRRATH